MSSSSRARNYSPNFSQKETNRAADDTYAEFSSFVGSNYRQVSLDGPTEYTKDLRYIKIGVKGKPLREERASAISNGFGGGTSYRRERDGVNDLERTFFLVPFVVQNSSGRKARKGRCCSFSFKFLLIQILVIVFLYFLVRYMTPLEYFDWAFNRN